MSGYSDGAGVKWGHCQSHDDETSAVLLENRPHHSGSDEQGKGNKICLDFQARVETINQINRYESIIQIFIK